MTRQKLGLAVLGAVAVAGLAYCAYSHKEEIYAKIQELKDDIAKKKDELGDMGRDKIAHVAHALIAIIEKYAGSNTEATLKDREAEIAKLKAELANLSK